MALLLHLSFVWVIIYLKFKIGKNNFLIKFFMLQTKSKKLELGCGERPTPGYLHQDVTVLEGVELDYSCNPWEIPIEKGSLDEIIALGVMEHLRYSDFHKTLKHLYSLLCEGGSFLFDVPDMKIWSEYLYNLTHGMQDKNPFTAVHIWSTFYGWQRWEGDEHKSGWIREDLIKALNDAGFTKFEEGVEIFTSKGFYRNRFARPHDAHIYIKAVK